MQVLAAEPARSGFGMHGGNLGEDKDALLSA
jgi:hypothetical protein